MLAYGNAGLGRVRVPWRGCFSENYYYFFSSYKSLQNNNGHVKKEFRIEVIIHEIKEYITCMLIENNVEY